MPRPVRNQNSDDKESEEKTYKPLPRPKSPEEIEYKSTFDRYIDKKQEVCRKVVKKSKQ